jgi:hypothetical protein
MFKDFVMPAKNQIQLSSGETLTINTYKMYANINHHYPQEHMDACWPGWISPTNLHNANTRKMLMIEAISNGSRAYQRVPGAEPIGFVIQVEIITVGNLDEEFYDYIYGCSVKSHLDKWDRMKGLKVAYNDLMKSFDTLDLSLTKDERRKVAEIVGLTNG